MFLTFLDDCCIKEKENINNMKSIVLSLAIGLISLAAFSQKGMMLENESKKSFDETIEWLEKTATKHKWKVTHVTDLQMSMEKNGYKVLPVKILALCQPHHAVKVLGKDDERIISSMMPCRISVYEKSDGKTYLSRINAKLLAANLEGAVKKLMAITTDEIEEMIKPILVK